MKWGPGPIGCTEAASPWQPGGTRRVGNVALVQGERERMIPFVQPDFIRSVDFDAGLVTVDWDADF